MLQMVLDNEIAEYIDAHSNLVDENNRRIIVRNGYSPKWMIISGM